MCRINCCYFTKSPFCTFYFFSTDHHNVLFMLKAFKKLFQKLEPSQVELVSAIPSLGMSNLWFELHSRTQTCKMWHGYTSLLIYNFICGVNGHQRFSNNTMKTFILNKDVINISFWNWSFLLFMVMVTSQQYIMVLKQCVLWYLINKYCVSVTPWKVNKVHLHY